MPSKLPHLNQDRLKGQQHDHDHDHDHSGHHHDHDHDHAHDHDHDGDKPKFEPVVVISDAGPARKKLSIEISAQHIAAKLDENFNTLSNQAVIPGFRRGRAPQRLLQKKFGSDVRKDVVTQLISEGYSFAVEKNELRVLGEPTAKEIEHLKLPDSGPMKFDLEIEVVPEFKLPELKGLEIKKPLIQVSDDRVAAEVERYCEMYGQPQGAEEAEGGDYLTADLEIRDEASVTIETVSQSQIYVPGENRKHKGVLAGIVVEDLGKKLEGRKAGDLVTINAEGPSRHENEKLRDKKLAIDVRITKIERVEPIEVSKLASMMGVESEEQVNARIREGLEAQINNEQRQAMHQQVIEHLNKSVQMELPKDLSSRQAERILQRRAMEMLYRGATRQDIEQQVAELRAASEAQAQHELKLLFILDAVAREFKIEVEEAEVNGRIVQLAIQQGRRPEKMRDEIVRSGQAEQLVLQIREEKAVAELIKNGKVVEISAIEWRKQQGLDELEEIKPRKKGGARKPAAKEEAKAEEKPAKSAKKAEDEDKPKKSASKAKKGDK